MDLQLTNQIDVLVSSNNYLWYLYTIMLASSPGHSHIFNVARRKEGGPGI